MESHDSQQNWNGYDGDSSEARAPSMRQYIFGPVFPKNSCFMNRPENKDISDHIPAHILSSLNLKGIPLTSGHPPNGLIQDMPEIIQGVVVDAVMSPEKDLWIVGELDTSKPGGKKAFDDMVSGVCKDLSLGHTCAQTQTSNGDLVGLQYAANHVGLVDQARREGSEVYSFASYEDISANGLTPGDLLRLIDKTKKLPGTKMTAVVAGTNGGAETKYEYFQPSTLVLGVVGRQRQKQQPQQQQHEQQQQQQLMTKRGGAPATAAAVAPETQEEDSDLVFLENSDFAAKTRPPSSSSGTTTTTKAAPLSTAVAAAAEGISSGRGRQDEGKEEVTKKKKNFTRADFFKAIGMKKEKTSAVFDYNEKETWLSDLTKASSNSISGRGAAIQTPSSSRSSENKKKIQKEISLVSPHSLSNSRASSTDRIMSSNSNNSMSNNGLSVNSLPINGGGGGASFDNNGAKLQQQHSIGVGASAGTVPRAQKKTMKSKDFLAGYHGIIQPNQRKGGGGNINMGQKGGMNAAAAASAGRRKVVGFTGAGAAAASDENQVEENNGKEDIGYDGDASIRSSSSSGGSDSTVDGTVAAANSSHSSSVHQQQETGSGGPAEDMYIDDELDSIIEGDSDRMPIGGKKYQISDIEASFKEMDERRQVKTVATLLNENVALAERAQKVRGLAASLRHARAELDGYKRAEAQRAAEDDRQLSESLVSKMEEILSRGLNQQQQGDEDQQLLQQQQQQMQGEMGSSSMNVGGEYYQDDVFSAPLPSDSGNEDPSTLFLRDFGMKRGSDINNSAPAGGAGVGENMFSSNYGQVPLQQQQQANRFGRTNAAAAAAGAGAAGAGVGAPSDRHPYSQASYFNQQQAAQGSRQQQQQVPPQQRGGRNSGQQQQSSSSFSGLKANEDHTKIKPTGLTARDIAMQIIGDMPLDRKRKFGQMFSTLQTVHVASADAGARLEQENAMKRQRFMNPNSGGGAYDPMQYQQQQQQQEYPAGGYSAMFPFLQGRSRADADMKNGMTGDGTGVFGDMNSFGMAGDTSYSSLLQRALEVSGNPRSKPVGNPFDIIDASTGEPIEFK